MYFEKNINLAHLYFQNKKVPVTLDSCCVVSCPREFSHCFKGILNIQNQVLVSLKKKKVHNAISKMEWRFQTPYQLLIRKPGKNRYFLLSLLTPP